MVHQGLLTEPPAAGEGSLSWWPGSGVDRSLARAEPALTDLPHHGDRLDRILALVRRHRPGLRLVDRHEVPWLWLAGEVARPVAGPINERFTTVIGDTVYLPGPPEGIDRDRLAATLAHELVHQLDQAEHGALFYLSYALAGPALRTRRAHWERRAYAVDLLLLREAGGESAVWRGAERLAGIFAGPSYGFMWAGRRAAEDYLAPTVESVLDGTLDGQPPYRQILEAWRG